jgi:[acyl-carrier-protein] S-malonyltransferase
MTEDTNIAVIFPGQGSQEPDMGKLLAESESDYMDLWKQAEKISGRPLREIYWGGTDHDMAETSGLQPALTVTNLTLWLHCRDRVESPVMAGHSLGEFSALAAAEVLSIAETVELTSLRGRLMAEAGSEDEGMTAILKVSKAEVERMVESARQGTGKEIRLANYNTPVQFVVSGKKEALDAVADLTKKEKGRAIPLPVSGAFHSPLIKEANKELAAAMDKMDWRAPRRPIYFNATAATEKDPSEILKIMKKQMVSPVKWMQTVERQWDDGARKWYEIGPKGVLSRMVPAILKDKEGEYSSENIGDAAKAEAVLG